MNKSCSNCGAQLDEAAKFCAGCGTQTVTEQPAQAEVQPVQQAQPAIQPEAQPPKKKKSKKPLIIGGAVGAVALALAAVLIFTNVFGLFKGGLFGGGKWQDWKPTNFGKATFTLDEANSVSGEYIADGKTPLTLTTTDSNGLTWTLIIPTDGYYKPVTITMTPMTGVSIGDLGSVPGGVQLSPDGINFTRPAKLTVSGEGITAKTNMLQGKHDGADVGLVKYENGGSGLTSWLYHFSTEYPNNNDLPDGKQNDMSSAAAAARDYLKGKREVPAINNYTRYGDFRCPQPNAMGVVTISHEDYNENGEEDAYKYLHKEFLQPELTMISELQAAMAQGDAGVYEDVITDLYNSLVDKYFDLMLNYWSSEYGWKIGAVVTEWMMANIYQTVDLGSFDRGRKLGVAYRLAEGWATEAWNYWMEALAQGHNFEAIHSLEEIARFNRKAYIAHNYEEMISFGLLFRLELPIEYTYDSTYQMGVIKGKVKAEAEWVRMQKPNDANVEYLGFVDQHYYHHDEKVGGYALYSYESYDFTTHGGCHTDEKDCQQILESNPENWLSVCLYDIDPCANRGKTGLVSIQIGIRDIGNYLIEGAQAPTYKHIPAEQPSFDFGDPRANDMLFLYAKVMGQFGKEHWGTTNPRVGVYYFFDCDLRNGEEYCVIQTFEGSNNKVKAEMQFNLIHTDYETYYFQTTGASNKEQWMQDGMKPGDVPEDLHNPYEDWDDEDWENWKKQREEMEQQWEDFKKKADEWQQDFDPYAPNNAVNPPNGGNGGNGGGGGSNLPPQPGAAWPTDKLPNGTPKYPDGKILVVSAPTPEMVTINISDTSAASFNKYADDLKKAGWTVTKISDASFDDGFTATKDGWTIKCFLQKTGVGLSFTNRGGGNGGGNDTDPSKPPTETSKPTDPPKPAADPPDWNLPNKNITTWPTAYLPKNMPKYPDGKINASCQAGNVYMTISGTSEKSLSAYYDTLKKDGWQIGAFSASYTEGGKGDWFICFTLSGGDLTLTVTHSDWG